MANIDIARALKDKVYFNSLSEEDKARVRAANPSGESSLGDSDLDTVSGGLGGGDNADATTTSTGASCTCGAALTMDDSGGGCSCSC